MKTMFLTLAGALALSACAADDSVETRAEARASGEAMLAAELRDYEQAGPATSCVNLRELRGNRSAGERAIIFEGNGNRLFVNRPAGGCPSLRGRALSTRTTSTQLCRGDIAVVFEPVSGMEYGACGLGDFTPYRRRDG